MNTKKLTLMSILLAIALTIFIIELQFPLPINIPGIKLGLANIVTLFALVWLGRKEAFIILVLRIILGSIFSGRMVGFMYSISGGLLCFIVMAVVIKFFSGDRLWITGVFGAISHNIGQLAAAIFIMSSPQLLGYLPVLIVAGVIAGAFTGLCAQLAVKRIKDGVFK